MLTKVIVKIQYINIKPKPQIYENNTNVIFKDKKEVVVQAINQFLIWYENNIKEWW